jgi:pimeloyl-ACP methyl ester carboxylesterase
MAVMRQRHRHGDAQLQQLFAQGRRLADRYDDVNFTPPYLETIEADTLIVFGDRDPLYPVSLAFELRSAIRRSHLWVVPNAGHAPVFGEYAPQFAAISLPFLHGKWPHVS